MLFVLLLFIGALVAFFLLIPAMLTIAIPVKPLAALRRRYVEFVTSYWFNFATYVTINVCGTQLFVYSSDPRILYDKGSLIIANHRTRVSTLVTDS